MTLALHQMSIWAGKFSTQIKVIVIVLNFIGHPTPVDPGQNAKLQKKIPHIKQLKILNQTDSSGQ